MANFLTKAERGFEIAEVDYTGMAVPLEAIQSYFDTSPVNVWQTQPSVRKVVDFIASNIAAIPLHLYDRTEEGRVRVRDGQLADVLRHPSVAREETAYLFWKRVLIDWLIYDRAAVYVDMEHSRLRRVPPASWSQSIDAVYGTIKHIKVRNAKGEFTKRDVNEFLILSGYSIPGAAGMSPMETLRDILAETSEALSFRSMMWKRQATHTGVVERSGPWKSAEARKNFLEGLRAFDAKSERSGGTMLLDEGMAWKDRKPSFTPSDLNDIEARKLTDVEVASLFHIAPEMLGIRSGNYSNMEAFRQSLYRDNLGPYIDGWEQACAPLVEAFGEPGQYIEAFLDAKLRGSFEEQAKTFQTSVGAPVMTRNEARRKMNLPDVDEGNLLVTPLNVLVGGQASPTDAGAQNERGSAPSFELKDDMPELSVKSWDFTPGWDAKATEILEAFFKRQRASVSSILGAKSAEWWDQERWDRELGDSLYKLAATFSDEVGREQAKALGFSADDYVPERTFAYLRKFSNSRATIINQKTMETVEAALVEDQPVGEALDGKAKVRAITAGGAFVASVSGWTSEEVARQTMAGQGFKTWIVTSGNPRASHASMNGETVPVGHAFSNGLQWPGDPSMGPSEAAGCMCGVQITHNPK